MQSDILLPILVGLVLPILALPGVSYLAIRKSGSTPMTEGEKNKWSAIRAKGKARFILMWSFGLAVFWTMGMMVFDYFHFGDHQPRGFERSVTYEVCSTAISGLLFGFVVSWTNWLGNERRYALAAVPDDPAVAGRNRRMQLQIFVVAVVGALLILIAALLRS